MKSWEIEFGHLYEIRDWGFIGTAMDVLLDPDGEAHVLLQLGEDAGSRRLIVPAPRLIPMSPRPDAA